MDAIIGRYRAHMQENGLVLTHPTAISFDLTPSEALELMNFIKVYQQALIMGEVETSPELRSITLHEDQKK